MTKYFVLRPHAVLSSYDSLQRFGEDNVVIVPMAVIDEINSFKDLSLEKEKIRRKVLRYLRSALSEGVLTDTGYQQENGSILKIVTNYNDCKIDIPNVTEYQRRTLQVCKGLQNEGHKVTLVTNNVALQIKAYKIGINAEEFKDEIFPVLEEQYTGRIEIEVSPDVINKMYSEHSVDIVEIPCFPEYEWYENCYVIMRCGDTTAYGKVHGSRIDKISVNREPYGVKPMNDGQRLLMDALFDDSQLVVVKGSAGTGKTLVSLASALARYDDGDFKKIIVTRHVRNDKLGYLPGTVDEKVSPFLQGIKDNLDVLINGDEVEGKPRIKAKKNKANFYGEDDKWGQSESGEYFFEKGIIKPQALEIIQGRSILKTLFIIDEAQNIEPEETKPIVTRAAKGAKFIFLGDPSQVENPKLSERYNALVFLTERMKGDTDCTVVTLKDEESVRSRLARVASKLL